MALHPPQRRRYLAVPAIAVLFLGACSHPPGVSNGSVSVCYRALPVGKAAVHDGSARLVGVHRIPVDSVRSHLPSWAKDQLAAEDDTSVCVMAFEGRFQAAQVDMAPAGQSGPYALVLVSSKGLHVVGAVLLRSLPKAFGGRTL
jgi:hypothetical protein